MASRWPLRLAPLGQLAMGATLWRLEGQLMATIVAKITASFALDQVMALIDPVPVREHDEHEAGHPMNSVIGARELAPQLYQVDVLMVGHAHPETMASQTRARLAMERRGTWIVNKLVTVFGDRDEAGTPQPFDKLRISWERAYGGIGHPDNPLGTGYGSSTTAAPNILYADGRELAASFSPIPPSFPARKRLLGGTPRKQVAEGIAQIPASFDWSYFQAAPTDQRLDMLSGDEWLHIEGMHPSLRRIRTRLPGVAIATHIYGHAAAGVPNAVPLRPDTVLVEPDELRASVVFRGSFPVMEAAALPNLIIAAGIETAHEPMMWPDDLHELEVLPFEIPPPTSSSSSTRSAPPPPSKAAPHPFEGTFALDPSMLSPGAAEALPFSGDRSPSAESKPPLPPSAESKPPLPVRSTPRSDPHPFEHTMSIADDMPIGGTLPFGGGDRPPSQPPASAPRDIPGAPWAREPADPVYPPEPATAVTSDATGRPPAVRTMFLGDDAEKLRAEVARRREEKAAAAAAPTDEATRQAAEQAREAEAASKRDAELQAQRELDDKAREQADAQAKREADEQAQRDAEARRNEEADRFRKEQEEAEHEAKRRAEEEAKAKRDAATKLRKSMYGGFKRKN
jgi:hypothetical protein